MIKNFQPKKGDQIAFTITFSEAISFTSIELAAKKNYSDSTYIIYRTLNDGISKLNNTTYQVTIPTTDLEYTSYIYDLRVMIGSTPYTPLSGRITIKPTVFEAYNG